MVKISNTSYENEIHRVESPFNEDFKNIHIFFQGGPNFGVGTAEQFRENGQKHGNLLLSKFGSGQF